MSKSRSRYPDEICPVRCPFTVSSLTHRLHRCTRNRNRKDILILCLYVRLLRYFFPNFPLRNNSKLVSFTFHIWLTTQITLAYSSSSAASPTAHTHTHIENINMLRLEQPYTSGTNSLFVQFLHLIETVRFILLFTQKEWWKPVIAWNSHFCGFVIRFFIVL